MFFFFIHDEKLQQLFEKYLHLYKMIEFYKVLDKKAALEPSFEFVSNSGPFHRASVYLYMSCLSPVQFQFSHNCKQHLDIHLNCSQCFFKFFTIQ